MDLHRRDLERAGLKSHARLVALLGSDVAEEDVIGVLAKLDRQGAAADLPLDAAVATQMLVLQGVLVQRVGGRVGFRRELLREAVVRGAPADVSQPIYRAMFEYFRDATALPEERRLSGLARSAAASGFGAIAASAYLKQAEQASARHLYVEAERFYSRSLEHASEGAGGSAAYRGRGLMRYRLGRYHDALADLAVAREAASAHGDVASEVELLLDEATALDWMHDYNRSEERVLRAKEIAGSDASALIQARLLLGLGRADYRKNRAQEAVALLENAVALAGTLGDAGYETRVIALLMLGFLFQGLGGLESQKQAATALGRAIDLCNERGDQAHLGAAVSNRALVRANQGDKKGMLEDFARVLAIARELGQATMELVGEYNLGEYLYLMDDLETAEPHVRRAIAIDAELTGGAPHPVVEILDARLRLCRGDESGARAIVTRIRETEANARKEGALGVSVSPSEDVLCSMVELSIRDASEAEWNALDARSAEHSIGPERIEVLEARLVSARRWGRGESVEEDAWRALSAALSAIPNLMGDRVRRRVGRVGGEP